MDTTLSALHFYAPILENSHPTIPLAEQLRILRVNIIVYLRVLDGIQRSILRQSLEEEKRELREKHEWYARTYRALRVNEREIQKAMIGTGQKDSLGN